VRAYRFEPDNPREIIGHGPGAAHTGRAGEVVHLGDETVAALRASYARRGDGDGVKLIPLDGEPAPTFTEVELLRAEVAKLKREVAHLQSIVDATPPTPAKRPPRNRKARTEA